MYGYPIQAISRRVKLLGLNSTQLHCLGCRNYPFSENIIYQVFSSILEFCLQMDHPWISYLQINWKFEVWVAFVSKYFFGAPSWLSLPRLFSSFVSWILWGPIWFDYHREFYALYGKCAFLYCTLLWMAWRMNSIPQSCNEGSSLIFQLGKLTLMVGRGLIKAIELGGDVNENDR